MSARSSYWSHSKFAKWVEKTFGGYDSPEAMSLEDWEKWRTETQAKARFTYWFIHSFLDTIQNIVYFPIDKFNDFRYYIRNRFFDKTHYLRTGLEPGKYYDFDTKILHGLFEGLVDFVEIEKAHMQLMSLDPKDYLPPPYRFSFLRWKSIRSRDLGMANLNWEASLDSPHLDPNERADHQAIAAREIIELYVWWKDFRPRRPDPYDSTGWKEVLEEVRERRGNHLLDAMELAKEDPVFAQKYRAAHTAAHVIEQEYEEEDEAMILRLIKIRKSLWT